MIECKFKRYNNQYNSPVVFVMVLSALVLSLGVVVTVSNEIPYFVNAQQQNITKTGIFNYTQTDTLANPNWIDTGNWSLTESPTVVLTFDAVIKMVKPDGSEAHEHVVRDLVIPYAPINQTNTTIIKGTTTITMSDGLFYSKVPTTITFNEKNISVYFDPARIGTHYGNQSITGSVHDIYIEVNKARPTIP
ncbi:MAG TPA: hypothetical protein VJR94_12690 [Candidatus Nitrosocosmicus sp.]|nr:hypothetical protein [Candidatus Nitrosocosmicus sp.]